MLEKITAKLTANRKRTAIGGREYFVAPMTLIVPGVLPGSSGPLYYPAEELSKNPSAWNHVPLIVYHSFVDGQPVSARDPMILDKQGIGMVMRARFTDKLVAEGWFDIQNTKMVDPRVWASLEKGTLIEISTGVGVDGVPVASGTTFNGVEYSHIAKNYRPDHVAILPDQKGACSLVDGCGVFNAEMEKFLTGCCCISNMEITEEVLNAALAHAELRKQLCAAVEKRFGTGMAGGVMGLHDYYPTTYVLEVYDKYVIYEAYGKTWKLGYKTDLRKSTVELAAEAPTEVRKETSYKPVTNQELEKENDVADTKKDTVNWLIANCDCWEEADRPTLEAMNEKKLLSLKVDSEGAKSAKASLEESKKSLEDFEVEGNLVTFNQTTKKWESKKKPAPTPVPAETRLTPEEQEDLAFARQERNRQKETLVGRLMVNVAQERKQAMYQHLMGKNLMELSTMVELLPPVAVQNQTPNSLNNFPIFQGQSAPIGAQVNNTWENESLDIIRE